ncbi:MAG: sigma-70 family RNA polymerase sigma factor [Cyanobacteria bacterium J06649_4]
MQIPTFPECDHALVSALASQSDYSLVNSLQRSPTEGKYFTALFCRYSPVVYSLIRHSAKSPVQADYLFALTWRHILNELSGIDLSPFSAKEATTSPDESATSTPEFSLQGWLINLTAAHINQVKMPDVESIHYVLQDAPPPLWCYTERALDGLLPRQRLIILMAQTFEWSDTRISAYLQAEGEPISAQQVQSELTVAYEALERAIPEDVRTIYLNYPPVIVPAPEEVGRMTIEFDEVDLQL